MLNQALAQQRQSEDPQALYRAMMLPQANAAMNAQPEPEPELDVEVEVEVEPDLTENQVGIKPSAEKNKCIKTKMYVISCLGALN